MFSDTQVWNDSELDLFTQALEKLPIKMSSCKNKLVLTLWNRLGNKLLVVPNILILLWDGTAHLSKGPSDLKQNGTQGKTQFSGIGPHALPGGVVYVPRCCSSENCLLNCQKLLTAYWKASKTYSMVLKSSRNKTNNSMRKRIEVN